MAISFDGPTKRISLDSASVSAAEIWSRWVDWHEANSQWPLAFRQTGGDVVDPTQGIYSPVYFFLLDGWRVRPMEASHTLVITGNLVVQGGGVPVVQTLGNFNVSVQYTVPVQAQGIATSGSSGPTADAIADAVRVELALELARLDAAITSRMAAGDPGLTTDQANRLTRIEKFLRNKRVTNPSTGVQTVYDDDGTTVLGQGNLFEDVAGTQPYRGDGAERAERLA